MFEFLYNIVLDYGVIGLFISSLIGSTIFIPFSIEITFPLMIFAGVSKFYIILFASLGAVAGTWVNYLLGMQGMHMVERYVRKKELDKAKSIMDKYGWVGLMAALAIPMPLPVDPITMLCGVTKMDPIHFTFAVLMGKILKYGFFLGLIALLL